LQNYASRHPHTAHQLGSARIFYRFHPFFCREVSVIRRLRADDSAVIVQVADSELKISVPGWMLERSFCDHLVLEAAARVDVNALRQLREIVDLQSAALRVDNMGSHSATGEPHGHEPSADSSANA
jgi:hypothetical protein